MRVYVVAKVSGVRNHKAREYIMANKKPPGLPDNRHCDLRRSAVAVIAKVTVKDPQVVPVLGMERKILWTKS